MTNYERFVLAEEINHLYNESSLEERMYEWMREADIEVERQMLINIENKLYFLDFALFCNIKNLDIECDGDVYHTLPVDVMRDKKRDNILQNHGWIVYRYHEKDIVAKGAEVIEQIKEAVNKFGGIKRISSRGKKFFDAQGQNELF